MQQVIGETMPLQLIRQMVGSMDRTEGLVTLSRIAADLVNKGEGITGAAARAWTHDLLAQRVESSDPLQARIARGVAGLAEGSAIVHGRVLFMLQALFMLFGATDGRPKPPDGQIAFLMLALNDHLPQWMLDSPGLSQDEETLALTIAESIFNHTFDDPLRFIVRSVEIIEGDLGESPLTRDEWRMIQSEALGCTFEEYAERFLLPIFLISRTWGYEKAPGLDPAIWCKNPSGEPFRNWFKEASGGIVDPSWVGNDTCPGGLPRLSGAFFRTPFLDIETAVGRRLLLTCLAVFGPVET